MTDPVPPPGQDVFHFDQGRASFEDLGQQNGSRWWWWSDLSRLLGYASAAGGQNAFNKAMTACNSLGVELHDNFQSFPRQDAKGFTVTDFRLSRFACYLIAMNADPRKPQVAKAQAYFATVAQAAQAAVDLAQDVERVAIREEVADGEQALASAAKRAGVHQYAFFQNAGYRGLYNMNLSQLRQRRGIPGGKTPLDYMGTTELAANLFRITQTEEKIRRTGVQGQALLESTAGEVGRQVRDAMKRISGVTPESLPTAPDIKLVKKGLKDTSKTFQKMDKSTLPKPEGS